MFHVQISTQSHSGFPLRGARFPLRGPMAILTVGILIVLLGSTAPAKAITHSTLAVPLSGIRLDGDLTDWPRGMSMQAIVNDFDVYGTTDLTGRDLTDSQDLTPVMMVGYQPDSDILYLAVEVRDDVNYNPRGPSHNQSDGLEIYVSGPGSLGQEPTKYVMVPGDHQFAGYQGNPGMRNGVMGRTRTRAVWRRQGDLTTYEWQIDLFDHEGQRSELSAGDVIGLDVVVVDHDGPGSGNAAWIPWGPALGNKWQGNDRIGRVLLGGGPPFDANSTVEPKDLVLSAWFARGARRVHGESATPHTRLHQAHADLTVGHRGHAGEVHVAVSSISSLVAGILTGVQEAVDDERVLEWMRQEGASEADLAEMREGLMEAQRELQLARIELQNGTGESRIAEALAMAIGEESIASAEASAIEFDHAPPMPPLSPRAIGFDIEGHAEEVSGIVFSALLGLALLVGAIGVTVTLMRRTGGGSGTKVTGMTDRIERIEQRLTDTQDVMIALSEKLDRFDEKTNKEVGQ